MCYSLRGMRVSALGLRVRLRIIGMFRLAGCHPGAEMSWHRIDSVRRATLREAESLSVPALFFRADSRLRAEGAIASRRELRPEEVRPARSAEGQYFWTVETR